MKDIVLEAQTKKGRFDVKVVSIGNDYFKDVESNKKYYLNDLTFSKYC